MPVDRLDHVNIQTTRLNDMVRWYEDVLGLRTGPRPDFPFSGAWLYAGDCAVIHLVGHGGLPAVGSEFDLKLEHFAFRASDSAEFEKRLIETGQQFDRVDLRSVSLVQLHIRDPDGNHVHLDFPTNE